MSEDFKNDPGWRYVQTIRDTEKERDDLRIRVDQMAAEILRAHDELDAVKFAAHMPQSQITAPSTISRMVGLAQTSTRR